MSRNGTGGYTLPANSWNPAVNGAAATAADWNSTAADIAAAIQQSVSSDGQTAMTGNLNLGGNKITNLANASVSGDAVSLGRLDETDAASLVAYLPDGTGAVATTVQSKLRESVSLQDFGAVGDGVTDDYLAIMKAHDALPADGGEVIVKGSFLHETPIVFSKNIRLVGDGTAQDHRVSPSEFVKGASILGTGVTLTGNGASVQSMAFRGITGNTGDGVCLLAARQVLRDVGVFNMGGNGVRVGIDSPSTYNCNLWYIENLHSKSNGAHGLEVSEGAGALADSNGGTAQHLDLQYNAGDGLYIRASQLGTYIGVNAQDNGAYGVHRGQDAKQNVIVGGDWEQNATSQLGIETGADYNHITNQTVSIGQISYPSMGLYRNSLHLMEFDGIASNITFPSTVASPYNEYTLAGYREQTFTPTVSGATTAGAANTYVSRIGKYTRIGNMVHFAIQVEWSGGHTGTGNTIITGLPFASLSSGPVVPLTIYQVGGPIPAAGTMRQALINNNTSQIALREINLSTMAATTNNAITPSGTFVIQGSYFIA